MTRRIRWICGVGIVFAVVLFSSTATAAPVGELGPLLERAAETLPSARAVEVPLPEVGVGLTAVDAARYGVDDRTAIEGLNSARSQAVDTVDSAALDVGRATESSEFEDEVDEQVKECAKEGFQGAAEKYATASEEEAEYGSWDDTFYSAAYDCLAGAFDAPPEAVEAVADYL